MSSKLAFIGTGVMGGAMASHLLAAGHSLAVHTRTKSKASKLLARGARWAESPADAAEGADVIFLCLPDTPDVESVITGDTGLLTRPRARQIVVDHSTISPAATRELCARLRDVGMHLLDAPVSGGDVGAKNATLSIMVGGEESAFKQVEPLLRLMGRAITYCGPSGNGQLTKLVNQILVSITNMAVSEAMTFAKKHHLDLRKTIAAVSAGAGQSWQLENLGPRMIVGDFKPGFMIDLQQKDLRLVLQAAEANNTSLPATALVHQLFAAAQAAGHGRDGTQALFAVLEKLCHLH
jgi:3-hydroxyisobutyrate dehydrogenase